MSPEQVHPGPCTKCTKQRWKSEKWENRRRKTKEIKLLTAAEVIGFTGATESDKCWLGFTEMLFGVSFNGVHSSPIKT